MKSISHKIDSGSIPIVFADGTAIYNKLAETYTSHDSGLFILAPSGVGKTTFVNNQSQKDWVDGDFLWVITGADYSHDEWSDSLNDIMEINARSDIITHQAKKQGLWIIGSSNLYLQPDAIVIPDWDTHLSYITSRQSDGYDGGATADNIESLKSHIAWITNTWQNKVPFFKSIEQATSYLMEQTK